MSFPGAVYLPTLTLDPAGSTRQYSSTRPNSVIFQKAGSLPNVQRPLRSYDNVPL